METTTRLLFEASWKVCRTTLIGATLSLLLWIGYLRQWAFRQRRQRRQKARSSLRQQKTLDPLVIAFFHPYCSAGGGGERVLWKMVEVLGQLGGDGNKKMPPLSIVVYTIDEPRPSYRQDLLQHVKDRFSITPQVELSFCHLNKHAHYLKRSNFLSLLVESIGTMRLAYQALLASCKSGNTCPDVFIDTTGCAFTYAVANLLFGCTVMAYVHYPTISTDMIALVFERRRSAYNHQAYIANSRFSTVIKLVYYVVFAFLYGLVGSLATSVLVNSTWTWQHICSLWRYAAWRKRIRVVYPPCLVEPPVGETKARQEEERRHQRPPVILSIGQFRPEKDHVLQLEALAKLYELHPELKVQMVLIGSCRGKSDQDRLEELQRRTRVLNLQDSVSFVVNQRYSVIQEWLAKASVGIHTMWNEHFGIGIVEMMAAGLIVVAHNSGGPKMDIVVPFSTTSTTKVAATGFLASTAEEYAEAIFQALTMKKDDAPKLRIQAQQRAQLFSDQVFADSFRESILDLPQFQPR